MNQAFVCAQLLEKPREVAVGGNNYEAHCRVALPPVGKKEPTYLDFIATYRAAPRFLGQFNEGDLVYIHGAVLKHDHTEGKHSLVTDYYTSIDKVTEEFGIKNTIILSGSCIKTLDTANPKDVRLTESGYLIWSQSMSAKTFGKEFNLFNLKALNKVDERFNLARLCCDYLNTKGQSATVYGQLVSDSWTRDTGEKATKTEILLKSMTLPRKPPATELKVQPQADVVESSKPASLWGGKTLADDIC